MTLITLNNPVEAVFRLGQTLAELTARDVDLTVQLPRAAFEAFCDCLIEQYGSLWNFSHNSINLIQPWGDITVEEMKP